MSDLVRFITPAGSVVRCQREKGVRLGFRPDIPKPKTPPKPVAKTAQKIED